MRTISILAVAASLLLPLTHSATAAAPKECGLKRYTAIDLQSGGLVPVKVNGQPATMTLNMAAYTIVWKRAADEMKLSRHQLPMTVNLYDNGARITEYANLQSLVIGDANLGKATLIVIDRDLGAGIVGAMGMDVFAHADFELDLAHGKLTLFSQDHCPGKVVYWTNEYSSAPFTISDNGGLHFPMEIEGRKVETSLAPLSGASVLRADASRALFDFDEFSPGVEVEQYSGAGTPSAHYRAMKITAPGIVITNSKIELRRSNDGCTLYGGKKGTVATYGDDCDGVYPLSIGRNVLQQLRIYFATKEKVMYFSAADAK